jgi:outer membrane protein TolC
MEMEKIVGISDPCNQRISTGRKKSCAQDYRKPRNRPFRLFLFLLVGLCLGLTACKAHLSQIRHDNASLVLTTSRARPIEAANNGKNVLALHDCVRLALGNNLDIQSALWDEQVKNKLARASLGKMLPRIQGSYNMSQRDTLPWSRSDVIGQEGLYEALGPAPGTGVTNYSTSRERFSRNWSAQLLWSPMDAAMARYLADVKWNEASQAHFQRARVAQQLVGTVTSAFWRLRALNEAAPKAQALETHRKNIARDLKSLLENALVESQEYLTAKTQLAEASQQFSEVHLNIGRQRELIATAMNVSPDSCFQVIGDLRLAVTGLDACKLEAAALVNRPEAYQADLAKESSIADQKRLMIRFFPRAEGFLGHFRDENKFYLDREWVDGGMRITWDLMDCLSNFLEHGAAKDRVYKTDRDRAVISLGILTQVRLKVLDAIKAFEKHKKTGELEDAAREIQRIARDVEQAKDRRATEKVIRIARERAMCNLLQAEIDRLMALGDAHAALAEVDTAVGTNYPVSEFHPPASPSPVEGLLCGATAQRPVQALKRAVGFFGGFLPH